MNEPGKYNDLCTRVREETEADAVILIVHKGNKGCGMSVQCIEERKEEVIGKLPSAMMMAAIAIMKEEKDDREKRSSDIIPE